ncbi:MAG: homocysteine S-methyltransferase family protein [Alphaproteobacteria bacterium]|nr:homocysteine S-methyltransferase family protein [Alphaproteobacteria bacterium]
MSPYPALLARLRAGGLVLLDGPTGTELQARGAPMDPGAWCGPATLGNDRLLVDIHSDYLRAGSSIVTANTFAASTLMLGASGLADKAEEIVQRAVAAARTARDAENPSAVVAGSLSHMMPRAAGKAMPDQREIPEEERVAESLNLLARQLKDAGCELIILEMMYRPRHIPLAVAAAKATGLPIWYGASARRGADGAVLSFDNVADTPLERVAKLIPAEGIDVAGIMHSGAETIAESLAIIRRHFAGPLMAYPDSGYFEMPDWRFVDTITPERFAAFCRVWIAAGAQLLGGCCGLGLEHIKAAAAVIAAVQQGG